jgi:spore germination cell wall hydrolase CwlJ-like protein
LADLNDANPPIWREWSGWLFWLAALALVVGVISSTNTPAPPNALEVQRLAKAPPPQVIPEAPPMELAAITPQDAAMQNAAIPLVKAGFVPAKPFLYSGAADQRMLAQDCLAAAMLYEAGDDARGQLAVGQVIINRARHPAFPKSICAVVFHGSERVTGCQFTFTCDGALSRRYSDAAWARAQAHASQMLSGKVAAEVGLATHYHTNWVRPYWSDTLDKIAIVDTHLFFRWPGYWGTPTAFRNAVSAVDAPVAKLAAISLAHRGGAILTEEGTLPLDEDLASAAKEAKVIAANKENGVRDTILVELDGRASPESFLTTALRLCGTRNYCKLFGWTNPTLKPQTEAMNDLHRAGMSFSYLRDDIAGFEKALWNCSEFKRDDARLCMKR